MAFFFVFVMKWLFCSKLRFSTFLSWNDIFVQNYVFQYFWTFRAFQTFWAFHTFHTFHTFRAFWAFHTFRAFWAFCSYSKRSFEQICHFMTKIWFRQKYDFDLFSNFYGNLDFMGGRPHCDHHQQWWLCPCVDVAGVLGRCWARAQKSITQQTVYLRSKQAQKSRLSEKRTSSFRTHLAQLHRLSHWSIRINGGGGAGHQ